MELDTEHGTARLSTADLIGCRALAAMTHDQVTRIFTDALSLCGATIVKVASHAYPGQGLTCVAILEESHAVVHTWPESGIVHVDVFTCSGTLRTREAIAALGRIFEAETVTIHDVPRASGVPT